MDPACTQRWLVCLLLSDHAIFVNKNELKRAIMKNLSLLTKVYILSTILLGFVLTVWMVVKLDWANIGLFLLSALGAVAQILKVEGPTDKTNYSIAWFVYGFAFILFGPLAALFVVVVSHLAEWIWHKYPWYIQSFNIGAHGIPVFLARLVFDARSQEMHTLEIATAMLIFVLGNHFLVGLVVKMARRQSFAQSGVFGILTLFLDFTVLSMGAVTALVWQSSPYTALLNMLPLYLLYNALRVPALTRQVQEMKNIRSQARLNASGD